MYIYFVSYQVTFTPLPAALRLGIEWIDTMLLAIFHAMPVIESCVIELDEPIYNAAMVKHLSQSILDKNPHVKTVEIINFIRLNEGES